MKKNLIYLIVIIILTSCTCDTSWEVNTNPVTQAPPEHVMPLELFKANIAETSYTALVYIERARVLQKPLWPFSKAAGYVNHEYEAKVIETFRGDAHKKITYTVMADADIDPYLSPYLMVVSLCGFGKTGYYVPDNGYVSPAFDELIDYGRNFKKYKRNDGKTGSICE